MKKKSNSHSVLIFFFLIFGALNIFPVVLSAQYFGQNKVNYDSFNFKILHTKHFDIYYYGEETAAAKYAAPIAERWYARHSIIMQDTLAGKQAIILYDGFPQFAETNVTSGFIGQGTGGFTEPYLRRITVSLAPTLFGDNHVIGHELVHAFQFDITGKNGMARHGLPSAAGMPLWLMEGMAEYFSLGPTDPFTAMWMREACLDKLPKISDLANTYKYFPYRYGQSLMAFIGGTYGNEMLANLLREAAVTKDMNRAFKNIFSISMDSLSTLWHNSLHSKYDPILKITSSPDKYGKVLIKGEKGAKSINVSPAISPDGKSVAFFSSRDLFAVDVFIADMKTGKTIKNVFRKELDSHLQNLEFINAAGAWSPDSRKFIFAGVKNGRPNLSILDVANGEIVRTINFPELAQIYSSSWSPDGNKIAFAALKEGFTNLFIYDLKKSKLTQITNDVYGELQPDWSPDGTSLVFTTERFSTDISDLNIGNLRLAVINLDLGKIFPLNSFAQGKNINPQWTSNNNIYFVSDRNGISNIYRLDLNDDKIYQITNLYGGISGISNFSPAISFSDEGKELTYSVFEKGHYSIYTINSLEKLHGFEPVDFPNGILAGTLPPDNRFPDKFLSDFYNNKIGLANAFPDSVTDYHPHLRLVGVSQPSAAVGIDRYGSYVGGGLTMYWSDMLGNHNLSTSLSLQASSLFTNISGLVGYYNTTNRWIWGVSVSQIPYTLSNSYSGYTNYDSSLVYFEQTELSAETNQDLNGIVAYPFDEHLRVQFNASYTRRTFTNKVRTRAISLETGKEVINKTVDLPHNPEMNIGTLGAALIYDNSYMGATAPLLGTRYHIEVAPVFGSVNWVNYLLDYRRYFMPLRPVTIAFRLLQYGRIGKNSDDSKIMPLYLGYPELVRGYESSSFTPQDCPNGNCSSYSSLFGTKMAIANAELRFPVFGLLGLGDGFYGYYPIDFVLFADGGVAWFKDEKPDFLGGSRKPVGSAGVALRANFMGYIVAEVDYVHPFNRPNTKWLWQFKFTQGF
jgi:Tol biopolymer transport system component